jgi:hypothetical protein
MKTQPPKGKYKLNTFVNLKLNTEFNNVGVPLKSIIYRLKAGDVIDVAKFQYNDKNSEWEAQISDIPQNLTVPMSILVKVNDLTPASAINKKAEEISSGTEQQFFGTSKSALQQTKEAATWGLGFAAFAVFLKWAKLI